MVCIQHVHSSIFFFQIFLFAKRSTLMRLLSRSKKINNVEYTCTIIQYTIVYYIKTITTNTVAVHFQLYAVYCNTHIQSQSYIHVVFKTEQHTMLKLKRIAGNSYVSNARSILIEADRPRVEEGERERERNSRELT